MSTKTEAPPAGRDARAARILARSLFRDMRQSGYSSPQILALATELIDLVTKDMRGEGEPDLVPEVRPDAALRRAG
jgi:hypothetical protein